MQGSFGKKQPLHILCLEDSSLDLELIRLELDKENIPFSLTQIWAWPDFEKALEDGGVDIVLSDSSLPAFDTLNALAFIRQKRPQIPFIFVSGNDSPKAKQEALGRGATDFISKNNLTPLNSLVKQVGFWNKGKHPDIQMPEVGVPVVVQCRGFRCLGYLGRDGKWWEWNGARELVDVVGWFRI